MSSKPVPYVMGDMENPDFKIPQQLRRHLEHKGYLPVVASSYPADKLGASYGYTMPHVFSIDPLLPFIPQAHGYQQLHRRIALAVRLGGIARAFQMFPEAELAMCGDSDGLPMMDASMLRGLLMDRDVFTCELPFIREEAPYGWVNDLGLVMSRRGFDKLAAALPDLAEVWMPDAAPHLSVHGLLAHAFRLAGLDVQKGRMEEGYYDFPSGRELFVLKRYMPEDAWMNSGAVLIVLGKPFFAHACMKTMPDLGVPVREMFGWWLDHLARYDSGNLRYKQLSARWREVTADIRNKLHAAGRPTDSAFYWQNWKTMQLLAEDQPVPELRPDGPVTAVTGDIIRAALTP